MSTVAADPGVVLSVRQATLDFPGIRALDGVSLQVRSGEVLALLGKNGSGKSSLVKVLAGLHVPDAGEVALHRGEMHFIHQDLGLVGSLSAAENLAIGRTGLRRLRRRAEAEHARTALARFGVHVDVRMPVDRLSPAQRTIVAIARALDGWSDPRGVLVLDEPTAALHGAEVDVLFRAVRAVTRAGAGVVFVSHRLAEVLAIADRAVVLRDGRTVADVPLAGRSITDLATLIIGESAAEPDLPSRSRPAGVGAPALSVRGLAGSRLHALDLDIRAGEILGVAGSLGSGREEVAGLIYGSVPRSAGSVDIAGADLRRASPRASTRRGVALVPADRHLAGAVMAHTLSENLALPHLRPFRRVAVHLSRRAERAEARRWIDRLGVHPPHTDRPLGLFSGGNQQKVVIGGRLRSDPTVLLVEEPTQGVDVGASLAVHGLVADAAARGAAVLVASSDNVDLIRMCHRVIVLRDGVAVSELAGGDLVDRRLTEECLGSGATLAAAGPDAALPDRTPEPTRG